MKEVLIVEDIYETRRWLGELAARAFPGCVISEASNMRAGISAVASNDYDLALIDLGLPDGSGLDVLRNLRLVQPKATCIVTTVMGEDSHIVAALSAGAEGYLLKEQPEDLLIQQLRQLAQGIPALTPSIARRIMEHFRYTGPAVDPDDELTEREKEVLALIGRGLRNAEVARELDLAEGTVATHIKSMYRKLGISTRAEAAWHAARMGLVIQPKRGR